jgi:hypothetical protein
VQAFRLAEDDDEEGTAETAETITTTHHERVPGVLGETLSSLR